MTRILNIIRCDLIKLTRDKTSLVFMVIMPVIFIFIFGSIKYTETTMIPVGIANSDNGEFSGELLKELKRDKTVSFTEIKEGDLLSKVQNANIEAGFVIQPGFSKNILDGKVPEIKVIKLKTSENSMVIENVIRTAMMKMRAKDSVKSFINDKIKGANAPQQQRVIDELNRKIDLNLQKPDFISVETTRFTGGQQSKSNDNKAFVTIGFMIMFVMMTIIFASAGVLLEEKKDNTWNRLVLTPTRRSTIMLGNILSSFLKGWLQVMFLVLFSKFVTGVNWGQSLMALMVLMSIFIISVTGIGIFLSTIIKTNAQLSAIASLVVTCTTMISGCYWPLEFEPEFMQKLAVLFPQYWAMKGMRNVIENNMGLQSVITPVMALAVIGILFFAASVLSGGFRMEIKKKHAGAENLAA